jgi:hypothetical protein
MKPDNMVDLIKALYLDLQPGRIRKRENSVLHLPIVVNHCANSTCVCNGMW